MNEIIVYDEHGYMWEEPRKAWLGYLNIQQTLELTEWCIYHELSIKISRLNIEDCQIIYLDNVRIKILQKIIKWAKEGHSYFTDRNINQLKEELKMRIKIKNEIKSK